MTIQILKAIKQCAPTKLFIMLYKVVLTFEIEDATLKLLQFFTLRIKQVITFKARRLQGTSCTVAQFFLDTIFFMIRTPYSLYIFHCRDYYVVLSFFYSELRVDIFEQTPVYGFFRLLGK